MSTSLKHLLSLKNTRLVKNKKVLLSDIHFTLQEGERVAIMGANGAGKTSLLRVLAGTIDFQGDRLVQAQVSMALVFQKPYILRLTTHTQLSLCLWWKGNSWQESKNRATQALEVVGLLDQANQPGRSLSGGQQQRLALARAWVCQPNLWLLDEPTASLDSSSKREIEALMLDFSKKDHTSLVWVSHQLSQVKKLATRIVFLDKGKVILDCPHSVFFNSQLWSTFPLPVQDLFNEEFIQ